MRQAHTHLPFPQTMSDMNTRRAATATVQEMLVFRDPKAQNIYPNGHGRNFGNQRQESGMQGSNTCKRYKILLNPEIR